MGQSGIRGIEEERGKGRDRERGRGRGRGGGGDRERGRGRWRGRGRERHTTAIMMDEPNKRLREILHSKILSPSNKG